MIEKINHVDIDILFVFEPLEPLCPSLKTVNLEIAQSWFWSPLATIMELLQGPAGQRGMLTVKLQTRLMRMSMTRYHAELLGRAIPNLRELIMQQSPSSYDGCTHETTCDLDSLVTLSKHTGSSLISLTCSLVVERPESLDTPPLEQSLFALKSLTLQHLGVRGDLVDWVSKYLAHLCPNLQSLEIECFMIKEGHEGWKRSSSTSLIDSFLFHQARSLSMDT